MGSRRRPSSTVGERRATAAPHKAAKGASRAGPLYKRLPHGPHRMQPDEVVLNQRARIHGALIEAVAQNGYEGTSVKRVIELAGVSRRSFYEQFANKEDCFLVTFDLIVRRDLQQIRTAYLTAEGPFEQRARAAFERVAETIESDPKAGTLVVLAAPQANAAGLLRLRATARACEQMLGRGFAESADAVALPVPIVRAIVGGLQGIAASALRDPGATQELDLTEEMLRWTLLLQTPAAEDLAERMAAGLAARMREISASYGGGHHGAEARGRDEGTRLLESMLRLLAREDYRALTAPQVADEANVSIEAFCALFADKQQCLHAAIDMIGDELLAIAADPELVSEDWAPAVRRVLAELMRYLANHPLHTRVLAQEALYAGGDAFDRIVDLVRAIATLLTEGAPTEAHGALVTEAVAGAIWHTIGCQVASGRLELLAAVSDHLSCVVLAPFIGAEAAIAAVTEQRPPSATGVRDCVLPVRQST
jgi:TetR/AcrR family transcriptional regulator